MRIAWFTPLGRDSAIGTFSRNVASELARSANVSLWVADEGELQPTELPVVRYADTPAKLDELETADIRVFNFGNYLPFHQAIYEVSRVHGGVAILHDRVLHHMFATYWLRDAANGAGYYVSRIRALYGREAGERAEAALGGRDAPAWELDEEVVRQPLYEEAIVNAEGVITHSGAHAEEVRGSWLGPVEQLHLPCYEDVLRRGAAASTAAPREDGRLRALVVGHINPNKRIDRIVDLLVADPELARMVHLDVVGADTFKAYADDIRRRAARHADSVSVTLHGSVPDDALERFLRDADIFVNLRYPPLESSSASLMEQLAHGRPTLVFDAGFFSEVPDDAVARVPAGDYEACRAMLRRLAREPELAASIGSNARRTAERYSVARYVDGLLAFFEDVRRWRPAVRTLVRVGSELGRMGVAEAVPIIDRIAADFGPVLAAAWDEPRAAAPTFRELAQPDLPAFRRFLESNDVPAVTGSFDPFPMSAATADRIMAERREDRYFGAFEEDGGMVALSMLRGWDEGFDVPSFGIAVDHRRHGRGLGTRLTAWTIERARELAAPAVRLSVYADNPAAARVYRRLGFEEVERDDVRARTRIVMRLDLNDASG